MNQPSLNNFCNEVFAINKTKGFDVSKENKGQTMMLIVSELTEALEADRESHYAEKESFIELVDKGIDFTHAFRAKIKDSFEDEIADAFIRLMDLVGAFEIDIDFHIREKMRYNSMREFKHGKK